MNKGNNRDADVLFVVPVRTALVVMAIIMATGFASCVLISLLFNFESSTATHCQVPNYLPSISAAIGYIPQRYIWRICVALIAGGHYGVVFLNYSFFSQNFVVYQQHLYQAIVKFSSLLAFAEISGLVGLTYVSSTENYPIHEKCFIVFIACSLTHMLLYLVVMRWAHEWEPLRGKFLKTYIHKRNSFIFCCSAVVLSLYFFVRHNSYCEPGVYTLFALCEYLVVLTNIYSHVLDVYFLFDERDISILGTKSHGS